MKAENIQKHMLRRTVVAAHGGLIGVIKQYDAEQGTAFVEGFRLNSTRNHGGGVRVGNIRKADANERAEFYERVEADERGVNDGFQRFGGMPRGFEAWRAAQTPAPEPVASAECSVGWMFTKSEPVTEPTPEPVVTPRHKVGDLRVWLRSNGIGAVARVMAYKDGVVTFAEYKAYNAADVFDPTPENVARLVEQQRERGIVPELGDLVFVLINRSVNATALVAHNVSTAPDAKLLQGVMCGGGAISWALAPTIAAHTLVIRRCPFRGAAQ